MPNSVSAHRGLGIAYSEDGQHDEAIAELKRALDALGEQSGRSWATSAPPTRARRNRAAAEAVAQGAADAGRRAQYVPSSAVAMIYAALGDQRRARSTGSRRRYDEHDFSIAQIDVAPWFKSLQRRGPRFQQTGQQGSGAGHEVATSRSGDASAALRAGLRVCRGLPKSVSRLARRAAVDPEHLHVLASTCAPGTNVIAPGVPADLIERHFARVHDLRAAGRVGAEDLADPVLPELRLGHLADVCDGDVALARDRARG